MAGHNNQALNENGWGALYDSAMVQNAISAANNNECSDWTKEMLRLCKPGQRVLELGVGTGQTSLELAKMGCDVTMLDFSAEVLQAGKKAAEGMGLSVSVVLHDILSGHLPDEIKNNSYDVIFSCGLLEHFEPEERVFILKKFKPVCKTMISMVPNAASLAYHLGKERMEKKGTWIWGKEIPVHTLMKEYYRAGYEVEDEYTIAQYNSLKFLDSDDELRILLAKLWDARQDRKGAYSNFYQGYLVVTIGR
jgi:cyclopropane fatty-acyl-phospholipid synthase-like methyltransferase